MVNSVINDIEKCDLFVEVLVTDNYPLNVRLFKLYSSDHKTLLPAVPHPTCPWRKLYLLFDFVHIIKSIRNNWLNLKDYDLSFTYPDMQLFSSLPISNSTTELNTAKFNDIRVLYKIEQHSTIKQAHRLSSKVCWPTSLERQNVNLALRIFNDSTCAALKIQNDLHPDSINDTSNFVDVMSKIWKIFNINTPIKHVRLNDEYSRPLADKDWRFVFLDSVCKWLERWSSTSRKDGKLSAQTFVSFRHSCITLPLITSHLTQNCGFDYVLSSRLQNDPIEHQFGIYRMMSGAQYHITYSQILESQRRLNLSNILKLFSLQQCKSELTLKQFINTFSLTANEPIHISYNQYFEVIHDLDSINLDIQVLQSIVFIGGYAVFSYLKTTNCYICVLKLTENKDIDISETTKYDLVRYIDRGSLKWPSDIVIGSIIVLWKIFTKIDENETLKKEFYFSPSRKVLIHLAENVLVDRYSEHWRNDCDSCSTSGWNIIRKILTTCTNCILANKVRNINSEISYSAKKSKDIQKFKKFESS